VDDAETLGSSGDGIHRGKVNLVKFSDGDISAEGSEGIDGAREGGSGGAGREGEVGDVEGRGRDEFGSALQVRGVELYPSGAATSDRARRDIVRAESRKEQRR
jgi:hypothetical protein